MPLPFRPVPARPARARGFTMVELMISITVLAVVVVVLTTVMLAAARSRNTTSNQVESTQAARAGMDMIARDLRSAGFAADLDYTASPQPPIAYIDSMEVLLCANLDPFPDTLTARRLPPLAYNPAGNPKPFRLNGTSWTPPIKYRTGAEIIRWTLDVTNDGSVNSGDVASAEGVDAQRTPNPNDYVLVRQVYGDSVGNVAGNNGGAMERIALVRKPGGTVPHLFTVYFRGNPTPWNWANGPVPASQLRDIERIVVQMTAPSARPDWRGQYAETRLRTEVSSLRNVPNFALTEFSVSGYVYDDTDKDHVKDGGESGLANVSVFIGGYMTTTTDANGFYQFSVPLGTYTLRHTPPDNYGCFTDPDSFVVTVGPAQTRSFADTLKKGGWLNVTVFNDEDKDGVKDGGEVIVEDVTLYVGADTTRTWVTNDLGLASIFLPVGAYSVTVSLPDSFTASSANPITGTMTNGGTVNKNFGMYLANFGTITGKVYVDNDRDGTYDAAEPGVKDVYVGVTNPSGQNMGFDYTDNQGNYSFKVPVNDPPHTAPYTIYCIPPTGYSAGTTMSLQDIYVQENQILTGKNFGLGSFYVIKANADRVLSVASGDFVEKDWAFTGTVIPRRDADIVLGAEASSKDNVMVWFNQYDSKPLFKKDPTYTRDAAQSVLATAVDSLDLVAPKSRPDVVTGTRYSPQGNLFVWFTQGTSGNEGFLPLAHNLNYTTADNGDVNVVLTADVAGGTSTDIIVGTKSTIAGQGTIEVWKSNDATSPTFTRDATYPPTGSIPSNQLGEVTGMAIGKISGSGSALDLVVCTRTGEWTGQLMFFELVSGKWAYQSKYTLTKAATSLALLDVNGDGKLDVVLGTQCGATCGTLQYWKNGNSFASFTLDAERAAQGPVMAVAKGDLGGITRDDLVVGWRESDLNYKGGVEIWYTDGGTLATSGVDPSGGAVKNMVTSVTIGNFDYGVFPVTPPAPYLLDFACGVKKDATSGELVIFVR